MFAAKFRNIESFTLVFSFLLSICFVHSPSVAFAGKIVVANNGIDSDSCGDASDPCRSVSRAVDNAAVGDSIVVGPGLYGDLDGNGVLGGAGEESGGLGCNCMIHVDKEVAVVSSTGAGGTVLRADGITGEVVAIDADAAVFGRRNKGFTVTGGNSVGIVVRTAAGVLIEGNMVQRNATGILDTGNNTRVRSNQINANDAAGLWGGGDAGQISYNLVANNGGSGIFLYAGSATVQRNLVSGNAHGLEISGGRIDATGNAIVGNAYSGAFIVEPIANESVTLMRNNFVGNGDADGGECGLLLVNVEDMTVDASGSFWGMRDGPAGDSADTVCDFGGARNVVATTPVATTETTVKVKPLR